MVRCYICNKKNPTAWFKGEKICQKCWAIIRYGDMDEYLKRMKKKLKGGE